MGRRRNRDLIFLTSFFILGGDFWDKIRALFVHGVPVTRTFQLDVRAGVGMVDNEPDWLAGAGLAFRPAH